MATRAIKVKIGTNTSLKDVIIPSNTTIRNALESNNLNYGNSQVFLGGTILLGDMLDRTFDDYAVQESCVLTCTVKADGGR